MVEISREQERSESKISFSTHDPHAFLGIHAVDGRSKVIRLFRPGAKEIYLEVGGRLVKAEPIDLSGHFTYAPACCCTAVDYRIFHQNGLCAHDPYAFSPTFGEQDAYFLSRGVLYEIYRVLGAKVMVHQGIKGTRFAVWAPSAVSVALIGDFNYWDGRANPMRSMGYSGVWELFVPGLEEGEKYKFEIRTESGSLHVKADPMAFFSELRPKTASVVFEVESYPWKDAIWMQKRAEKNHQASPMNIYELHLGSWKKKEGYFLNYREIATELAAYCKEMGFTHVELMPITEHPLDESWGYQVTGFYSATSRYGTPRDFQFFVDHLHSEGIGVILDWVPAHFPKDDFSLARFDGTALYEHEDPKKGVHPHWNTHIFNYGRKEVANFLIGSALFWLEVMHVDGLRVDAVASMLYLDYGREEGQWIANYFGGRENLEAIDFIKHLNAIVHEKAPGALIFAEESTAFCGVTHPLPWGGLGFDMKWNMGWMNDTLSYFHTDSFFRHYHHDQLTFGLIYAFSERFVLVLSHDEVVHGKGSLISKMPGDSWQRFANVRLLYSYMICQPGKKLLFMGGELGQWDEWNCCGELHWFLLNFPIHDGLKRYVKELNHFYLARSAFWERDCEWQGFEWIDFSDRTNSVISYLRKAKDMTLLCVHNFTPNYFSHYLVRLCHIQQIREVFNTDREEYGGSGKINEKVDVYSEGFVIQLAPLATMIFEVYIG